MSTATEIVATLANGWIGWDTIDRRLVVALAVTLILCWVVAMITPDGEDVSPEEWDNDLATYGPTERNGR